jgi:hypothetical protein
VPAGDGKTNPRRRQDDGDNEKMTMRSMKRMSSWGQSRGVKKWYASSLTSQVHGIVSHTTTLPNH